MKKPLVFLLILVPVAIFVILYHSRPYLICPVDYKDNIIIRSDGRGDGFFASHRNGRRLHLGVDLAAPLYAPVKAARSGKVISATANRGMGKYVIISHGRGITTLYGHLSAIDVVPAQRVRQGQVIGKVGKTGNARFSGIQPHLHFEIRQNGIYQDPLEYMIRYKENPKLQIPNHK